MKIQNRYASAVNSSNLKIQYETKMSDTDVLGAYGIADRRLANGIDHFTKHPLAVPLERLFMGDSTAAQEIIRILVEIIRKKAPSMRVSVTQVQARDMAKAALAWFRSPACRACGGHGFKLIRNTRTLGDMRCRPCNGTGKTQLEMAFRLEQRELIRWIMTRMELESALAGPAAMKALAPSLNL